MSARVLWGVIGLLLVSGVVALVAIWYMRPNDGPVRLLQPAPRAGDAFTFAGSFPPEGGTPLRNPRGIDVRDGFVYVAEADAGQVVVYGTEGNRVGSLVIPAAASGAKSYPTDVAAISQDTLAIVDTTGRRVVVAKLNRARDLVRVDELDARGDGALKNPTAVAASEGRLFVADADRGEVLIFDEDLRFSQAIGASVQPKLSFVGGLSVRGDKVWATDANSGRVVRLSTDGDPPLVLDRSFDLPRGLSADGATGRVVVSDVFASSLVAFRPGGQYVGETTGEGLSGATSASALEKPEDVAWETGKMRVYVTDAGDGSVKVFNVIASR